MLTKIELSLLLLAGLTFLCGAYCGHLAARLRADARGLADGLRDDLAWAGQAILAPFRWALRTADEYAPVLKTGTANNALAAKLVTWAAILFPALKLDVGLLGDLIMGAAATYLYFRTVYRRRHATKVFAEGGAMGPGAAADLAGA